MSRRRRPAQKRDTSGTSTAGSGAHQPVLFEETLAALVPHPGGKYVDGTVGAGGHARGILELSAPDGRLLGIDRDDHGRLHHSGAMLYLA